MISIIVRFEKKLDFVLSILIPTYNYNIVPLVKQLIYQAEKLKIKFEILCLDDYSNQCFINKNSEVNNLKNTKYLQSEKNNGRVLTRQILSDHAKYEWLLFLDADVLPKSNLFLKDYLFKLKLDYDVFFGGFAYETLQPKNEAILRWKYGKKFEEVDAKKRNKKPYQLIISANFLIKKKIFQKISSKIKRKSYGLDNYFASLLKQYNIKVLHLNNEVLHLGLENSKIYLTKIEDAIVTLLWAYKKNKIPKHDNKLLALFTTCKYYKLNYFLIPFYRNFSSVIKRNLLGNNPNLYLLQLYKLAYICYKDLDEK